MPRRRKAISNRVFSDVRLDEMAMTMMAAGWSTGYNKKCTGHFAAFARTCLAHEWCPMPASERTLVRYAVFRFNTTDNLASSFVKALYGIKQAHTRSGRTLDITQNVMGTLAMVVKAWKKKRPSKIRRLPITSNVLTSFFGHIDRSTYDNSVLRAMLSWAKFAMMRVSEYTYGPDGNSPRIGDIRLFPDAVNTRFVILYFSKSKTNQTGEIERTICTCTCPQVCAVCELKNMLALRGAFELDEPLFVFRSGLEPRAKHVRAAIKRLCKLCGLNADNFCTHGLRAGGITDALCAGVPDSVLQLLSRHKSLESLRPYKKPSDERLGVLLDKYMAEDPTAQLWIKQGIL
jgi:hypothetical protein